ncbi:MAG TPA: C10 family peptidase [Bacteroidales bacterium]|nr:C10 family peptidase [Bacteroidales bacterium]
MNFKMKISLLSLWVLSLPYVIFAEPVTSETAKKVVIAKIALSGYGNEFSIKNITAVNNGDLIRFYAAELSPAGYMIVAADNDLPPVIAYSYINNLDAEGTFLKILKNDISQRLAYKENAPAQKIKNRKMQWEALTNDTDRLLVVSQQWPPAGTTSTGGWLETNWTQSAPYNQMCPIDPVTLSRSYVGCPATAMAQILNYHKTTNNTVFDDGDDYNHNYSGRTFTIDDDFSLHGFPSFPQLNAYLDTLNSHYLNNILPTNQDKAALSFACGVAATQIFTSEGSGTFGVNQAMEAYSRFGCTTAQLLWSADTSLFTRLIQNMMDSLPAHLAIVDESNSSGHNVVVDGYNTDNYFHVNFGWGGSSNGWYLLPDEIPYGLTVIEGVILDIMKNEYASTPQIETISPLAAYPNPVSDLITIVCPQKTIIEILNIQGQILKTVYTSSAETIVSLENMASGIYVIRAISDKESVIQKFIKR